jgi:putative transcription factor
VGLAFGKAVVAARSTKNWTRKQLSDACRVPDATVAAYENGSAKPDGAIINKLNRALGVTLPKIPKVKPSGQLCYDDEM